MQHIVAGKDLGIADRFRAAAPIGNDPARLAHQQAACGGVPRLEAAFPENLVTTGRPPGRKRPR